MSSSVDNLQKSQYSIDHKKIDQKISIATKIFYHYYSHTKDDFFIFFSLSLLI